MNANPRRSLLRRVALVTLIISTAACTSSTEPDPTLSGFRGVRPVLRSEDLGLRISSVLVANGEDLATDVAFAAYVYDAVVLASLAAQLEGSDGSRLASRLTEVAAGGTVCRSAQDCLILAKSAGDLDYDGYSGPLTMNSIGDVIESDYDVVTFGEDNRLSPDLTTQIRNRPLAEPSRTVPLVSGERPGDGVLKIGALLPLSGSRSRSGRSLQIAAELAVEDVNAAGGVNDVPVELYVVDSGDVSTTLVDDGVSLLELWDADVVVGPMSTGLLERVAERIIGAGVPIISPGASLAALDDLPDGGMFFRVIASDSLLGSALATVIMDEGGSRVFVVAVDDEYGSAIYARLEAELSARRLDLVGSVRYDSLNALEDDLASLISESGADTLVLVGYEESARILLGLIRNGLGPSTIRMLGVDGNSGDFLGSAFDELVTSSEPD